MPDKFNRARNIIKRSGQTLGQVKGNLKPLAGQIQQNAERSKAAYDREAAKTDAAYKILSGASGLRLPLTMIGHLKSCLSGYCFLAALNEGVDKFFYFTTFATDQMVVVRTFV